MKNKKCEHKIKEILEIITRADIRYPQGDIAVALRTEKKIACYKCKVCGELVEEILSHHTTPSQPVAGSNYIWC